ncbi:MAG: M1 family metallopeptidase [Paludibacter sp.]|nr:M1 family metallopeptidase [Paludibacter sp.]
MKHSRPYIILITRIRLILLCIALGVMSSQAYAVEYFQQTVNYNIRVTLHDKTHELSAYEEVEYINNSPDTLRQLYFHLWPNAYSNNKTDLAKQLFTTRGKERLFNDPALRGYIDSLNFEVDNVAVRWNLLPGQPDICLILLNKPLVQGDHIIISTPFHVKIPKGVTSRLGHIGESYQVSQWYPKPAVYDQTGWHPMPYLDQGEFYSEFGSFDVHITLPQNYIVGASGDLQNTRETAMLDSLAADTTWIKAARLGRTNFPPSALQTKTLDYRGNNLHDFAWFADKRFHVLKSKVTLPGSGKEVTTRLMFTNQQSGLWRNAIPYIDNAILDFSAWIGDYPYNSFTAVQSALNAGLGMEYPGITVIGLTKDAYSLDKVIAHEACHNWFYGALGSNERRFPYMDEGMTTAYEVRYLTKRYPGRKLWQNYLKKESQAKFLQIDQLPEQRTMELEWLMAARSNNEQPINLSSTDYDANGYNLFPYSKAAISFNYLRAYLGDSTFDAIIKDYYREWKFKHPQPDNLRNKFELHAQQDMNWFFDDLIGTTKQIDYKIIRYENKQLLIRNVGELNAPFQLGALSGDTVCARKWINGFAGEQWINTPPQHYTEFRIDPDHVMPLVDRQNNHIRTSGIFPKASALQPQLLLSIEDPEKHALMYMPVANWNQETGIMVGVALSNGIVIPKPLEYFLMPFYTFSNSTIVGYGRIGYNITPNNKTIRLAKITLEGLQFGAPGGQLYRKLSAGLNIHFRPVTVTNPIRQRAYVRYLLASDLSEIENGLNARMNPYIQLGYTVEKTSLVNPYNMLLSFESGKTYQKAAIDCNYKLSYTGRANGLEVRLFAGAVLSNTASNAVYNLAPAGRSGRELYLYDGTFPDRFGVYPTTVFSRQMTVSEGGLVSPVNGMLGYSKWLVSLSLSSNLPGKAGRVGVKPFVNLLLNDHGTGAGNNSPFFAEAGLKVGIWNFAEIYLPLLVTNNVLACTGSIKNRIRIVFNIDFTNPGKISMGI